MYGSTKALSSNYWDNLGISHFQSQKYVSVRIAQNTTVVSKSCPPPFLTCYLITKLFPVLQILCNTFLFSTIINVLHSFILFHININSSNCNPFSMFAEGGYILRKVYAQYISQFRTYHVNDRGCCCSSINPKGFYKALINV